MTPARLALVKAEALLVERLKQLVQKIAAGDELAWGDYVPTAAALAAVIPHTQPGASGELITTSEMAQRLGISPKTLLRRARAGQLTPGRMVKRGGSSVRWQA